MADGYVDAIVAIGGLWGGEERRDGPALHDVERVVRQAPFDVLRTADVTFDRSADALEPHDLLVRPRWLLGADLLVDDGFVADFVDVRVDSARDERLAQAEAGLDGRELAVAGERVGRKQNSGRLGDDHPLDDHGESDLLVVEAVL